MELDRAEGIRGGEATDLSLDPVKVAKLSEIIHNVYISTVLLGTCFQSGRRSETLSTRFHICSATSELICWTRGLGNPLDSWSTEVIGGTGHLSSEVFGGHCVTAAGMWQIVCTVMTGLLLSNQLHLLQKLMVGGEKFVSMLVSVFPFFNLANPMV